MIQGRGLVKTFVHHRSIREILVRPLERARVTRALRGVDLEIHRGEIFGLLGPNGAGKTTLIKIFSCLVLPDAGSASIDGIDVADEYRVKAKIGLVHSDERSFYWRLSARQNLRFFARLYDVPVPRIESRIEELLERVDLLSEADRPFSGFSAGMKQRVAIARALLHDPPILLMDEPTRSLDPASSRDLRGFIQDQLQRRDGKTILLATHNLREAEVLADRIAILVAGQVRQIGSVSEVRRWGVREQLYRLQLADVTGPLEGPFRTLSDEAAGDGTRRVTLSPAGGADLDEVLRALLQAGARVVSCDRLEPDLEEAFARILEAERTDAGGSA